MKFGGGDTLSKVIKIPTGFVSGRGTLKQDHLESIHRRWEDMNDPHGHITVMDMCLGVRDLFVKLVSHINHGSYEVIEIIIVRKFYTFIVASGMELGHGTFQFILCLQ